MLGTFFNHEKNEWLYYFSNGIAVVVYIITGIVGILASLMHKHSERLRLIHFKQYFDVLFPKGIAINHISFSWQDFFSIDVQRFVIPSGVGNHTGDLWWKFLPIQFWLCYLIVAYHRSHVVSHCFHQQLCFDVVLKNATIADSDVPRSHWYSLCNVSENIVRRASNCQCPLTNGPTSLFSVIL